MWFLLKTIVFIFLLILFGSVMHLHFRVSYNFLLFLFDFWFFLMMSVDVFCQKNLGFFLFLRKKGLWALCSQFCQSYLCSSSVKIGILLQKSYHFYKTYFNII